MNCTTPNANKLSTRGLRPGRICARLHAIADMFAELTGKRIRRGVFVSVEDLQKAIEEFLATWNSNPKPFVWTATVESIV